MQMFFHVEVAARRLLTPAMLRMTFTGKDLAAFQSTGIGDEYLRLFFPNEESGEVVLPIIDAQGRWSYQDGKPPVRCATYTVRRFDAERLALDVDIVLHEGGTAASWARTAEPGSPMILNRPRGLYAPPADTAWQLLMADETGIPALARLMELTPAYLHSRIVIEVAAASHRQPLPAHPRATVTWLDGSGNGIGPSRLDIAFAAIELPPGPGYIWVAGEQKPVRVIRRRVKAEHGLPPERHKLVAYWIEDSPSWQAEAPCLTERLRGELAIDWGR